MISLPDFASLQAALSMPLDPTLHQLLAERIADAIACGVEDITHILVVEPGDVEDDFLREAAFSPFYNPISDTRFGGSDFEPHWDWAEQHHDWYEWLSCIGNDGFARIVLVPIEDTVDSDSIEMLRTHVPKRR